MLVAVAPVIASCIRFAALVEKVRFLNGNNLTVTLSKNLALFWKKIRDFAAHILFENLRFWTKIRDFAAHFLFENQRF